MMDKPNDVTVADLRFFLQHLPGEMRVMIQCENDSSILHHVAECWPDPDNNIYTFSADIKREPCERR